MSQQHTNNTPRQLSRRQLLTDSAHAACGAGVLGLGLGLYGEQALGHDLTEIDESRMGLAVLIDRETCLNLQGLRCDVCYRVCPLIDKAITLEHRRDRPARPGARWRDAVMQAPATAERGELKDWLIANRWLLARRCSQLTVMGLFLLGPTTGIWWLKGNLNSSRFLDTVPMTDPLLFLQSFGSGLLSGRLPETTLVIGALLISSVYAVAGGRVFCSWVCPLNMVTDAAAWLRRRLGIRQARRLSRHLRFAILAMALLLPVATGYMLWELINPVSLLHRGLLFGMGLGWLGILAVFLFDLLYARNGFCGHLCPQGALYSLIGKHSPLKVSAVGRSRCDNCMDCFPLCPEPHVIRPALYGEKRGQGPEIVASDCTKCGRCIDICSKDVFTFKT